MYLEEHGYKNLDTLYRDYDVLRKASSDTRKALKDSETVIKGLNEQIHYTGQYLANKDMYQEFLKSKNKGAYRKKFEAEILLYESARGWLKTHAEDGSMPSYVMMSSRSIPSISFILSSVARVMLPSSVHVPAGIS